MKTEFNFTDEVVEDMSIRAGFDGRDVVLNLPKLRQLTKIVVKQMLSERAFREAIFQEELEKRSKVDETREVTRKQFNELSELVDEVVWCLVKSAYPMQVGAKIQNRAEFLHKRKQIAELQSKIKRLENED